MTTLFQRVKRLQLASELLFSFWRFRVNESWCNWIADRVPAYLQGRESDVKTLRQALAENNFAIIQKIAHNIKGTGAAYGFNAITEIGSRMEVAAKTGNRPQIDVCVSQLSDFLSQVAPESEQRNQAIQKARVAEAGHEPLRH